MKIIESSIQQMFQKSKGFQHSENGYVIPMIFQDSNFERIVSVGHAHHLFPPKNQPLKQRDPLQTNGSQDHNNCNPEQCPLSYSISG